MPIRLRGLSVGATHVAAVMGGVDAAGEMQYGRDVLWWGNNEFYQLGTGRRSNTSVPVYIPVLEGAGVRAGEMTGSSSSGEGRRSGVVGGGEMGSGRFMGGRQVHRFQVAPGGKVGGRMVEQRVVCGRGNSAVWSAVCG